ncbi:MAG: hypothetical protein ACI89J_003600 [Hyphomicrobiaceae bacterium]|jgi:hypothetical protein
MEQMRQNIRDALVKKFDWFLHASPPSNICPIRRDGLLPKTPRPAILPVDFDEPYGRAGNSEILCLHPLGSKHLHVGTAGDGASSRVFFAICADHLPESLGLDWSYGWDVQKGRIDSSAEQKTAAEIFTTIADELGSITSYESIPADLLRVCCDDITEAVCWPPDSCPGIWPRLTSVEDKDIANFQDPSKEVVKFATE